MDERGALKRTRCQNVFTDSSKEGLVDREEVLGDIYMTGHEIEEEALSTGLVFYALWAKQREVTGNDSK